MYMFDRDPPLALCEREINVWLLASAHSAVVTYGVFVPLRDAKCSKATKLECVNSGKERYHDLLHTFYPYFCMPLCGFLSFNSLNKEESLFDS